MEWILFYNQFDNKTNAEDTERIDSKNIRTQTISKNIL